MEIEMEIRDWRFDRVFDWSGQVESRERGLKDEEEEDLRLDGDEGDFHRIYSDKSSFNQWVIWWET